MNKFLLILLSIFLTISIFGNVGENPYSTIKGKTLKYKNYYDGDKIGNATVTIHDDGFTYDNKFKIRAYLVFSYNYKSKIKVKFNNMGVTYVKSKTNNDGDKYKFTLNTKEGVLKKGKKELKNFKGLSLGFIVSKKSRENLTSSWQTFKILDIEKGKITKFKRKSAGTKTIKVNDKKYKTFMIKWVRGKRKGLSYYDVNTGILVRSDVTKGGNTLIMKIQ